MNKNRIFFTHGVKAFLFILLTISFLVPSGATAAVNTVSPDNVTINMFDYWVAQDDQGHPETDGTPLYDETPNGLINKTHLLLFGKNTENISETTNSPWNRCDKQQPIYRLVHPILGSDGYPHLDLNDARPSGALQNLNTSESLAYLFDPDVSHNGKASYSNVGGLLQDDNYENYGRCYYYDSTKNFASLDTNTHEFSLSETGLVTAENTPDQNNQQTKGQFFPFNSPEQLRESTTSIDSVINHYFGMTLAVDFHQPENGKLNEQDMIFHFAGDDDVWVYIDDVLVAALGGLHAAAGVDINFATGEITYSYNHDNTSLDNDVYYDAKTLKDVFQYAYTYKNDNTGIGIGPFVRRRTDTPHTCREYEK